MTAPNSNGDTPDAALPPPLPSGRWVRIALAASLAVNLGIAGVVTGVMFRNGGPMHGEAMTRDLGFGPFTEALSKTDRGELRRALLTKLPELRDGRRATRQEFSALLLQLRTVPLDEEGLRAAFDRQNARNLERLDLGQKLIFDLIVGMSDVARQEFAGRLEQSLTKRPKRNANAVQP